MSIPTEPIGSIPRPPALLEAVARTGSGDTADLEPLYEAAIRDTIRQLEATGSPVVTDGEQRKYHNFYIALAAEPDRRRVLAILKSHLRPGQRIFIGVTSPIDPRIETAEEVRDFVLEAARYIPLSQLGTTDDCGFSPFSDDTSTTREVAFAKIRARVEGTALAAAALGSA